MRTLCKVCALLAALVLSGQLHAVQAEEALQTEVLDDRPAGEGTAAPPDMDAFALERRLEQERLSRHSSFAILPHRPNYLLPAAYNFSPNSRPYSDASGPGENIDRTEVKFQFSFKVPLRESLFGDTGTLYAAYTQLSFWQAYNSRVSAPFRETNYEPELMLGFRTGYDLAGIQSRFIVLSFNHQSNGMTEPLSRSWNRVAADLIFQKGRLYLSLKPWYRIPEKAEDDDNPDIARYYGHGELYALYKLSKQSFGLMVRNNLRRHEDNKGAVQLDWSIPLGDKLRFYVQYFNGYGESLIDYNHSNNRISMGIMLTDWL